MSSSNNQPPRAQSRLGYDQSSRALQQNQRSSPSAGTALAKINEHRDFLSARMKQIGEWVQNGVRPEALVRFALRDMDGEKGTALRTCTPQSIYLGLLACAVTGLEPGALKGEAYLVPFKGEATFMVGYRGIIKQARRSRDVVAIWSNVVYDQDEFEVDLGSANKLVHKPRLGQRGKDIIAAYAIARMVNGQDEIELMDRDDLDAVRKAGNNSPAWKDWPDQMMRKAPIRRLGKRLPLGADYYVAMALDDAATPEAQRQVIEIETSEASKVDAQAAIAAEMAAQTSAVSADEAAEIARIEREQEGR